MTRLLILGAGGHGRVVADTVLFSEHSDTIIAGFLDDNPALWGTTVLDHAPVLGAIIDYYEHDAEALVLAIGENATRRDIVHRLGLIAPLRWHTVIHPRATVSASATIGPGTMIMANAVVSAGAVVGSHTIINTAATVDHDCQVGDYVHLAPGTHLGGGVAIGDGSLVGIGGVVKSYCTVGEWVTIGAGSVVVHDVPDQVTAMGVPARWNASG